MTYILLRGMGEPGLRPIGRPDIFRDNPTADLDGNGWIETAELREYARRTIPVLAEQFPGLIRGPGPGPPDRSEAAAVLSPALDKTGSFRLIECPAPPGRDVKPPGRQPDTPAGRFSAPHARFWREGRGGLASTAGSLWWSKMAR